MKRTGIKFLLLTGIFIFLNCALVNAATINWMPTGAHYNYSVNKINGIVVDEATQKLGQINFSDLSDNGINALKTVSKNLADIIASGGGPTGVGGTLNAGASGGFNSENNSMYSKAYMHYDLNDLTDTQSLTMEMKVTSWVSATFTVDGPSDFMLTGAFEDPIDFATFSSSAFWNASYENVGGITLTELAMVDGTFGASLNEWGYGLDDFTDGTISELVALRNWDPDGETDVGYALKVGFTGAIDSHVQNLNTGYPGGRQGPLYSDYILGTEDNPLELTAQLTSAAAVPVPGAFILLFSGLCALFGFRFTFIRKN